MSDNSYIKFILDILSPLTGIKCTKMFGGYGIYKDNIFFAIMAQDILYFKVDDINRNDYQEYESKPFSYKNKNKKSIVMSYWQVPSDILENQNELINWVNKAVNAAKRTKN